MATAVIPVAIEVGREILAQPKVREAIAGLIGKAEKWFSGTKQGSTRFSWVSQLARLTIRTLAGSGQIPASPEAAEKISDAELAAVIETIFQNMKERGELQPVPTQGRLALVRIVGEVKILEGL